MSNKSMGTGVGMGIHRANIKKVYGWLWHSWMEARREVPVLRWVGLACVATAAAAIVTAFSGGGTRLQLVGYGVTAVLYALEIPVIFYLLFEVYRKHRTDAIFETVRSVDDGIKQLAENLQQPHATLDQNHKLLEGLRTVGWLIVVLLAIVIWRQH